MPDTATRDATTGKAAVGREKSSVNPAAMPNELSSTDIGSETVTVELDAQTYARLKDFCENEGHAESRTLRKAVNSYISRLRADKMVEDLVRMQNDPVHGPEYLAEFELWERAAREDLPKLEAEFDAAFGSS